MCEQIPLSDMDEEEITSQFESYLLCNKEKGLGNLLFSLLKAVEKANKLSKKYKLNKQLRMFYFKPFSQKKIICPLKRLIKQIIST